jgi:hypothetical protein
VRVGAEKPQGYADFALRYRVAIHGSETAALRWQLSFFCMSNPPGRTLK